MDAEYFKNAICEELEGAKDYAMRAMEIKPMSATWHGKLVEMSTQELAHAKQLFAMWQEYYGIQTKNRMDNIPEYLEKMNTCITETYLEELAKVQMIHSQIK